MQFLPSLFFIPFFCILVYLSWQKIVFRTNSLKAAHIIGLDCIQSGNKTVYEGLYAGRVLKIETKKVGWGKTAYTRIRFTVTTNLPPNVFLKLKFRPNVENIILVEGEQITAEMLFSIEGYPQELFIIGFESRKEVGFKLIEGIKYLKSKSNPIIEIQDKHMCLEHSNFTLKSEQIVWLFSALRLIADVIETN